LIDFGFAKTKLIAGDNEKSGSLPYAAPELLNTGLYQPQMADVWSLGILLYVMATGEFPFIMDDESAVRKMICQGALIYPQGMDRQLKCLLKRMTKVNPNERPTVDMILRSSFFDGIVEECHKGAESQVEVQSDVDLIV
jgi:serine kinase